MDAKLKQRIERLRAMAQDASSENEAMIAAGRLQALLARHGLSEADLGGDGPAYGHDNLEAPAGPWARKIATAVARLYFCQVYYYSRGRKGVTLVVNGADRYRDTAVTVIQAVLRVVQAEARMSSRTQRPAGTAPNSWIASFRAGAAQRIGARCYELIRAARDGRLQDEEGTTLPVLASLYDQENRAVQSYIDSQVAGLRSHKDPLTARSKAGLQAGDACGSRVPLGNEIGKHAPKSLPEK